jgi:hypothetical protein
MMPVTINKEAMTAEQRAYPLRPNLAEFVVEVANANPLLEFMCDSHCTTKDWNNKKDNGNGGTGAYDHFTYKVKVLQDGEEVGALSTSTRYRRSVGAEMVYGVESFRIRKERGRDDTTYSKDLKVALRTAKKTLVARATDEMFNHVYAQVKNNLDTLWSSVRNGVRYAIDMSDEAMAYAQAAYSAHKQGKTTVEMPVKLKSVRDYDEYLRRCEQLDCVGNLHANFTNREGYAIKVLEDGKIVSVNLEDNTVVKYQDIDSLPSDMANKFVMFKVINAHEPYEHLGVKFDNGFFFITK